MARPTSRRPSQPAATSVNPMVIGIGGLAALIVVLLLLSRGGSKPAAAAPNQAPPKVENAPPAAKPAAAPVAASAKAGKAPSRPAPALTPETLGKLDELLGKAKASYNAGVTARTAGDNSAARDHQAKAKDALDAWKAMIEAPLAWQDEASMEGWAMPAEYVALEKAYSEYSTLQKRVRMGGGQ